MENIVRKGELACHKQFLLSTLYGTCFFFFFSFQMHFKMSAIRFNFDQSKTLSSGNGLKEKISTGGNHLIVFPYHQTSDRYVHQTSDRYVLRQQLL